MDSMDNNQMIKIYFNSEKCTGCHTCEFACAVEHSKTKDPLYAHLEPHTPVARRNIAPAGHTVLTIGCRHCEPAPCIDACITAALGRKDGYVTLDENKCVSCAMCVMVCPFDAVKPGTYATVKCDMCPDRDDFACVSGCPTKALFSMTEEEFSDYTAIAESTLQGKS
jgi:carbon-monoxide dehydrogenase iron sulfur subunit